MSQIRPNPAYMLPLQQQSYSSQNYSSQQHQYPSSLDGPGWNQTQRPQGKPSRQSMIQQTMMSPLPYPATVSPMNPYMNDQRGPYPPSTQPPVGLSGGRKSKRMSAMQQQLPPLVSPQQMMMPQQGYSPVYSQMPSPMQMQPAPQQQWYGQPQALPGNRSGFPSNPMMNSPQRPPMMMMAPSPQPGPMRPGGIMPGYGQAMQAQQQQYYPNQYQQSAMGPYQPSSFAPNMRPPMMQPNPRMPQQPQQNFSAFPPMGPQGYQQYPGYPEAQQPPLQRPSSSHSINSSRPGSASSSKSGIVEHPNSFRTGAGSSSKSGRQTPTEKRSSLSTQERYYKYGSRGSLHEVDFDSYDLMDWRQLKSRDGSMRLPAGLGHTETEEWREKKGKMSRMQQYSNDVRRRMKGA